MMKDGEGLHEESRRRERLSVEVPVDFRIDGDRHGEIYRARTNDLNTLGVSLAIEEETEKVMSSVSKRTCSITLFFNVEDRDSGSEAGEAVIVDGKVQWFDSPEDTGGPLLIGVAFDPDSREKIHHLESTLLQ